MTGPADNVTETATPTRRAIAVVGAGAVGSYVGGRLAGNHDVTLIDAWPAHIEAIKERGLEIKEVGQDSVDSIVVNALHISEVQSLRRHPVEIAMVCCKSYDTAWSTELIKSYLAQDGYVVCLQNGINEDTAARVVGWGKVVGVIASAIAVGLEQPGRVARSVRPGGHAHTVFRAGEIHGRITTRLSALVAALATVDSAKATSDLWGERWSKLIVNSSAGLVAITGLQTGELFQLREAQSVIIRLAGEAIRVGNALGYELDTVYGVPAEIVLSAIRGDAEPIGLLNAALVQTSVKMTATTLPSIAQDIQKGRRTEIDALNGYIVAKADEAGIEAPTHAALTAVVKDIEIGVIRPDVKLLSRLH